MTTDDSTEKSWQPRFYFMIAVSCAIALGMSYFFFPRDFTTGFILGYSVAGMFAGIFLAVQHWSLTATREVDSRV